MDKDNINIPTNKQEYKVMIQCCTYNQSQYIEDTLKGFAMQHTNFPFVCCIIDDASTDGEQEVLKRWIGNHCNIEDVEVYDHPLTALYIARDKDNPNCIYAIHLQKVNTYGKPEKQEMIDSWRMRCEYEAFCEGDDYWIDSLKLQKQVDFLEKNLNYSCCHTAFNCVDHDSKSLYREDYERKIRMGFNGERFWYTMLVENYILTCTFMMRTNFSITIPGHYHDYGIFLHAARQGYVGFLPDRTSCYRQTPGSIMNDPKKKQKLSELSKKIIVNEVKNVIYKVNGTIKEVYEFPPMDRAISRILIYCLSSKDFNLIKEIVKIYFKIPKFLFMGLFYKFFKKQPRDFYVEV